MSVLRETEGAGPIRCILDQTDVRAPAADVAAAISTRFYPGMRPKPQGFASEFGISDPTEVPRNPVRQFVRGPLTWASLVLGDDRQFGKFCRRHADVLEALGHDAIVAREHRDQEIHGRHPATPVSDRPLMGIPQEADDIIR
jgi:hypothetical protein